jgi:hypothetical protein
LGQHRGKAWSCDGQGIWFHADIRTNARSGAWDTTNTCPGARLRAEIATNSPPGTQLGTILPLGVKIKVGGELGETLVLGESSGAMLTLGPQSLDTAWKRAGLGDSDWRAARQGSNLVASWVTVSLNSYYCRDNAIRRRARLEARLRAGSDTHTRRTTTAGAALELGRNSKARQTAGRIARRSCRSC